MTDVVRHRPRAIAPRPAGVRQGARNFTETSAKAITATTQSHYDYEWSRFLAWCEQESTAERPLPTLPTTPQVVASYFGALNTPGTYTDSKGRSYQRNGCSAATFKLIRSAILRRHRGLPVGNPGRDLDLDVPEIRDFLTAVKKEFHAAGRSNKAEPFMIEDWLDLNEMIGDSDNPVDVRDLALLGLGLVRAMRGPSELLKLNLGALADGARGVLTMRGADAAIRMHVTKTSQSEADKHERKVLDGPVLTAVRRWMSLAGVLPGSRVFRPIKFNPRARTAAGQYSIQPGELSGRALHKIVQNRAEQLYRARNGHLTQAQLAELAPAHAARYSTHSLRHGALTSLGAAGATLSELMELSRHSPNSANIVSGYVRPDQQGAEKIRSAGL